MKFVFFPIAIIALQQSTKATAATNWSVPTGGSATIDCPSDGASQCCVQGQHWENVSGGAGSSVTFNRSSSICYGGSGNKLSGCVTEPACVFPCEGACTVQGASKIGVPSGAEAEAAATTSTAATATSSGAMMTTTEATTTTATTTEAEAAATTTTGATASTAAASSEATTTATTTGATTATTTTPVASDPSSAPAPSMVVAAAASTIAAISAFLV